MLQPSTNDDAISILLIGDTDHREFSRARDSLDALGRVTGVGNAEAAAELLADGEVVAEVIVVAQAYPSQFSHAAIDRIRRLAPLARVLGLMGSWCEGEMRSGKPWPGVLRVYWHQWPPRCDREISRMLRGQCSAWGLPITATDEERLLAASDERASDATGMIAVYTRRFLMADWLATACGSRGQSTVWLRPPRLARVDRATAAIFDGSALDDGELAKLKHLVVMLAPAPVVVLLDFPRVEGHRRAIAAGAATVLSKPLLVDDLFWELDRLLSVV